MRNLKTGVTIYFQEVTLTVLSLAIVAVEVMGIAVISVGIIGA